MKKLILLFAGLLLTSYMIGQNLSLSDEQGNPLTAGQTVYVIGDPTSGSEFLLYIQVTNNGSAAMSVKVCRTEDNVVPGVLEQFCWAGACFPYGTDTSFTAATINPGQTDVSFESKYIHNDQFGESQYTYTWFDENNPSDQVSIIAIFKLSNVGISDILDEAQVSMAYPNPANNFVYFDFELPEFATNTTFVVTNLLGAVVKEVPVTGNIGNIKINTTDLENGLYFGSLKIGNRITSTQRIIVNH